MQLYRLYQWNCINATLNKVCTTIYTGFQQLWSVIDAREGDEHLHDAPSNICIAERSEGKDSLWSPGDSYVTPWGMKFKVTKQANWFALLHLSRSRMSETPHPSETLYLLPFWILKNHTEATPGQSSVMHSCKTGIKPQSKGEGRAGDGCRCVLYPASYSANRGEASPISPPCCIKP